MVGYFALETGKTYLTVDSWSPRRFSGWVNGAMMLDREIAIERGLPNLFIGGSGTSYEEPWAGDIAEVLVYRRLLSETERVQIEDYLATKYSLTLERNAINLPIGEDM